MAVQVGAAPGRGNRWTRPERQGLLLITVVLGACPVFAYFDATLWPVAVAGAVLALALCARAHVAAPHRVVATGVSWQILVFLAGLFTMAIGLRNAGVAGWLSDVYDDGGIAVIGIVSAVGSAFLTHSMALTNVVAIQETVDPEQRDFLAALVGGDLGPRLLPIGSLAGLLWLAVLDRPAVPVPLRQFIRVGALVTGPSLTISLAVLVLVS